MPRKYWVVLVLLLCLMLPAVLVVIEYTQNNPARVEDLPDFGVHIEAAARRNIVWYSDLTWARLYVRWDEIELIPGNYAWKSNLDADIEVLKDHDAQLLLTIITTPDWARQYPELRCSPPTAQYLDDYAAFVIAVIDRYKPQAVELTNEPEIPNTEIGNLDKWMGCWGPEGNYYAEMLKRIYPLVKAAHPKVIVVAGSLMLDDSMELFWSDVLANGGSGNYDALSFHVYTYYPLDDYERVAEKTLVLRSLGETAPLWLTETSRLCYDEYIECSQDFYNEQADYFRYITENYKQIGLDKVIWHTLANNNWRHSDLVEMDQPNPAWYLYRNANSNLNRRFGSNK